MKILFISGYTDKVIAHWDMLDEDVNFIQKPFSIKDLAFISAGGSERKVSVAA